MTDRAAFRPILGFATILLISAPSAAQNQAALVNRTLVVLGGLCGAGPSDPTLATLSCDVSAGVEGAPQQTQDALTISPREQAAAASTATNTTESQVEAESERLELARLEAEEGDDDARLGVFLNGSGGWGEVDATGEAEDYDVWGGGVQLGADYRLSDNFVAGLGFGWNRQNTEFDTQGAANGDPVAVGGGEIESDSYTPSLYASFFSGPFHADGIFTYTYVDYESDRPVVVVGTGSDLFANASGDTHADQIGTSVNLGYDFQLDGLAVGPTAGVDFRQTWIDGYSESDVAGLPLKYDDQDITSLVTSLGAEASYAISTGFGVLVPYIRTTWEHEFENDARNIDARLFLNDTGADDLLISRTNAPDRDYARLGAGVSAQLGGGVSAFLDYDTILGLHQVEFHRLTAGGRIEF